MALDLMLYTHSFDGGGAERVTVQLANHWSMLGARVALALDTPEGPLGGDLDASVDVVDLRQRRGLLASPALAAALRRHRPSGLISAMTVQNVTACIARRLVGEQTRVLTVEHNFMSAALATMPFPRGPMLRTLMRFAYPFADAVAAVSHASARDLEDIIGLPSGAVNALYNPIWPLAPTPGLAPSILHPWLGGDTPALLTAGRLVPQKNHALLLEALAIARRTRPLRLLLLGEGPLREALEAQAAALDVADAVDFLGFRRDVADFLQAADLFVLSSDREGLPLSLLEALSLGTPVVSTDCQSGPREILRDGAVGALTPVGDANALAAAILATLAAPPPREALTARAADFDTDAVARRYEALVYTDSDAPWRC